LSADIIANCLDEAISSKAITLQEHKFFSEPLLTTLLMLGWVSAAHILKQLPKAEVWGSIYKNFQARVRTGRCSPGGL